MCVWRWREQGERWLRVILHSVHTQPRYYISFLKSTGRGSGGHVVGFAPRGFDGVKRNAVRATGPNLLFFRIILSPSYQSSGMWRSPNKHQCIYRPTSLTTTTTVRRGGSFVHGEGTRRGRVDPGNITSIHCTQDMWNFNRFKIWFRVIDLLSYSSLNDAKREWEDADGNKHACCISTFVAMACWFVFLLSEKFLEASLGCLYGYCFLYFPPIFLGVGDGGWGGEQVEILDILDASNAYSKGDVTHPFKDPRVSSLGTMRCKQLTKLCACGWRGTPHRACADYPWLDDYSPIWISGNRQLPPLFYPRFIGDLLTYLFPLYFSEGQVSYLVVFLSHLGP